ncbi:T4 family baseplate hub assembly chaperone [Myxococcus sp. NMCA1]|uniref:T4 family baseplate hub assembly chaperone n=1 Tax=Myxococcus sp. NMCA1 TaxID=2996785 RepID=UPI0022862CB2|nr:hypothetical protein [Myxococcus sp. NMCA1]WAM28309.1 hypothetical protein OZ403_09380 [Myxococcus sp. NMCA1]
MADIISCPSGLTGRIRGMRVREERVLADRKLAKSGGQVDELLSACWEEMQEAGPYAFADGKVDWSRVLQGDRFYALLQVRILTYGPEYAFAVPCQNAACRSRIDWELDLTQLPVRALSDASRAAFMAGNRFETALPDAGTRVRFKLLTGEDERRLPQLQRAAPEKLLSSVLAYRVLDVDGVDARDKRRFLEDLSLRDADFLVDEFDRVDCGVDTTLEVECPECFMRQEVELPFDRGFFLPGQARTTRRRERSTSSPA